MKATHISEADEITSVNLEVLGLLPLSGYLPLLAFPTQLQAGCFRAFHDWEGTSPGEWRYPYPKAQSPFPHVAGAARFRRGLVL